MTNFAVITNVVIKRIHCIAKTKIRISNQSESLWHRHRYDDFTYNITGTDIATEKLEKEPRNKSAAGIA